MYIDLTQLIKDTLGCKNGTENAPRPSNMTENQYSENKQFTTSPEPHSYTTPSHLRHSSPESLHEAGSAVFKVITVHMYLWDLNKLVITL